MSNQITEITRRFIFDYFRASKIDWAGRLREDDFLSRLYDLIELPSTDSRMKNAAGDIYQHRYNWQDWDDDWIFTDERFNLLKGSDESFLKFVCETVHPVVRSIESEASSMVEQFNNRLSNDGFTIVPIGEISGRPIYGFQEYGQPQTVFPEETGWQKVDRQLQSIKSSLHTAVNEEDYQTVGLLSREVLITVAQELYDITKHPPTSGTTPSKTDTKRMLEDIIAVELSGSSYREARAHARASIQLALALQHDRNADFQKAALCAEAATSVVNLLAIIAGRRGRML